MSVLLELNGVDAGYNKRTVIRDINLSLNEGEIIAVIGPNGAGKTTLLKAIGGLIEPSNGTIEIAGKNIDQISNKELAVIMALMFTERIFSENNTCFEIAAMGRYPYTGSFGLLSEHDRHVVCEAMELTGVLELSDKKFSSISDGQRQRVLLARAIAQEPDILVLDEPTSYLDIRHKLDFLKLLKILAEKKHTGIIMSIHEPEYAWMAADKICAMTDEGRIDITGAPGEVVMDDILSGLYGLKPGEISHLYEGFSEALCQKH